MLTEATLQRLKERAADLNQDVDRYINYLLDTKMTGKTSTGVVATIPIHQLPLAHDEVFEAVILKDDGKTLKFRIPKLGMEAVFKIKTPKNLLGIQFEFNQEAMFLYTEFLSNNKNKINGSIQLHQA